MQGVQSVVVYLDSTQHCIKENEIYKVRFPLPELTGLIIILASGNARPSTRAVNSGSGNRA